MLNSKKDYELQRLENIVVSNFHSSMQQEARKIIRESNSVWFALPRLLDELKPAPSLFSDLKADLDRYYKCRESPEDTPPVKSTPAFSIWGFLSFAGWLFCVIFLMGKCSA